MPRCGAASRDETRTLAGLACNWLHSGTCRRSVEAKPPNLHRQPLSTHSTPPLTTARPPHAHSLPLHQFAPSQSHRIDTALFGRCRTAIRRRQGGNRACRALRDRSATWSDATATTKSPRGGPATPMSSTMTTRSIRTRTTSCRPSQMASGRPTRAKD